MIKKVVSIFKNRTFLVTLLIALFLTSALIIAAMWLGQESGNFVIRIEDETNTRTIALTESDDPSDESTYVTRLTTTGIGNFHDNTLSYFLSKGSELDDIQEITSVMGVNHSFMESSDTSSQQSSLYCYTFYIVNTSSSAFTVNVQMNYSGISKNLDEAIRILTYNDSNTGSVYIYQKEDSEYIDYVNNHGYYTQPINFISDSVAYQETISLGQGTEEDRYPKYVKYSVLFWLEGNDPDCDDSILGGAIKFDLDISVQG